MTEKPILYIDMDGVVVDYDAGAAEFKRRFPHIEFPQSEYGFFVNLLPLNDGIEAVKKLIASDKYDVWILTRPSPKNPPCYMEKRIWIERYFGMELCEQLIISTNKTLSKGAYLIDDWDWDFEGEHIKFGTEKFPDWKTVLNYLL